MDISAPTSGAYASTWPASSSQGSVCLAFGEAYTFDKTAYTHRGIDIAAAAGEDVRSPVTGTVSFAGRVPSADSLKESSSGQETMVAVSIELEDGRTVTLMPLEGLAVKKGQRIFEGAFIGTLGVAGDRSSSAPHLHMGLRDGKRYCDPMSLFGNAPAEPEQATAPAVTASSVNSVEPATGQSLVPAAPGAAWDEEPDTQGSQAASTPEPSFGTISSGDPAFATYAAVEEPANGIASLPAAIGLACRAQLNSLLAGCGELGKRLGLPVQLLVLASVAFVIAVATTVAVPVFNLIRRRVACEKVSENSSLCKTKGGASIYGLFPAPGTSFITRGRLAQRR